MWIIFNLLNANLEQVKIIEMSQMEVEFNEKRPQRINSATNWNREFAKFTVKIILTRFLKIESHLIPIVRGSY